MPDNEILALLNQSTVVATTNFLQTVANLQQKFDAAAQLVASAQTTLTALQSNNQSVKENLQALFQIHEFLAGPVGNLAAIAGYDLVQAQAAVNKVKNNINQAQLLVAIDIEKLKAVTIAVGIVKDKKPNIEYFKTFAQTTFQAWLNQDTEFDLDGESFTFRFFTSTNASFFHPSANLTVEAIYRKAYRVRITGVHLKYIPGVNNDLPVPVIDWSSATLNPPSASGIVQGMLTEALEEIEIPLPFGVESVELISGSGASPASIAVILSIGEISGFDGLSGKVQLRINANGKVVAHGAGEVQLPIKVPIGTTGLVFDGLAVAYNPQPRNLLGFGTKIVPAAPGTGHLIALGIQVEFPLQAPGKGILFTGDFKVATQTAGTITDGKISTSEVAAKLRIPAAGGISPFGPESVFKLEAAFLLDRKAFNLSGKVSVFKVFSGEMRAVIGFDGNGYVYGSMSALSVANATVTTAWKPGFQDISVAARATARVKVAGLAAASVTVQIDARLVGDSRKIHIKTKLFGINVDVDLPEAATDLVVFLTTYGASNALAIGQLILDRASDVLAAADVFNQNSGLRRSLAQLDVFNGNSQAAAVVNSISAEFDRFAVNFRNAISLDRFTNPWKQEHFVTIGNSILDSLPGDINSSKADFTSFCQSLSDSTVSADFLEGEGTPPEEDQRIESRVQLNFNQVVGSLVGVEVVNSPGFGIPSGNWTLMAAFLITGSTFTSRASRSKSEEIAVWGYVTIDYVQEGIPYKRAKIILPDMPDASLLGARSRTYRLIKDALIATHGQFLAFGTPDNEDVDLNDPGDPDSANPNVFPPQPGTPPDEEEKPLPLIEDQGSIADGPFQIVLKNETARKLRVKTLRVVNQEPQVFSIDLQANQSSSPVTFLGGSVRGVAAWDLTTGNLVSMAPEPIYQNRTVSIKDRPNLPVVEDLGIVNASQNFIVRFHNMSGRTIRLKTVRINNEDPQVYWVDLPPNNVSPDVVYFGGSIRVLAIWSLDDTKLIVLQPFPLYKSLVVAYRELVEMFADGTIRKHPLLTIEGV